MAERVFLHVGQPKTGTTYLQTILWAHRDRIAENNGVCVPGDTRVDHLWTSLAVREDPRLHKRSERAPGAIGRVLDASAAWPGTVVVSHEFFGAARADQAAALVERFAPAEVHVVVTAREPASLMAAAWQESLKFRQTTPLRDFATGPEDDTSKVWSLRSLDLAGVLDRWAPAVPTGQVHVLPLPHRRGEPDELWHRFAGLLGIEATAYDTAVARANPSMPLIETELLRRLTPRLTTFRDPLARHRWVRSHLAETLLAGRPGDRVGLYDDQVAACRARGEAAVEAVRRHGVQVHGDLDDLRVPASLPVQHTPDDVSEADLAAAAVRTLATMVTDLRRLREEGPPPT